ncbi:pfs domain-containing protein [Dendryphion nanum]|uniref:Pfs domain-containing protein n=1 Tax=Dendryphion nanum TaxID=256645 RepID=A0A9P9EE99_9PLEO|nr:pfs domain-containing protein [Dendryphion nanum]
MDPPRFSTTEYSVGWICALPIELAAAQAMLDEKHAEQSVNNHDPSIYTLGRIGSHNVVLTCLPAGQMGIGPAAAGATRMLSRFRSIRFGLMVGIGGGVPSAEADIRLGDVVISQPYKQHSGVVQYDYGKTGRDGSMTRIGSLSPPPKVLLNAVSQLRANQHRRISSLAVHLAVFDQLQDFSREAAGADILFEATYNHDGGASCEQCSKERIVHHKKRRPEEEVTTHYGIIASGNQVMKDGVTRDRLSAELGGVLCFEMEAAGLMNDFPCLVVRGICDYADSHKNKAWQPYAAATAAACAKEILSLIPPAEVAATEAAGELCKYYIPFSLKGVPVGKFADRLRDTQALEQELLLQTQPSRRRTMVVHGLGGIGKTQLAADFARRHCNSFSAVLWLDGSSESSLKRSLAACVSRIPQGQVPEVSRKYAAGQGGDVDVVIKDVLGWLATPDNSDWLVVVDNIDRDDRRREEDAEAYNIEQYLPEADHGAVLITTRLPHLGQLGAQWEAKKVDNNHARAIFEVWYGKPIGKESEELLALLDGLPLALAQAAAYICENRTSFETYTRLYKEQWRKLLEPQDGKQVSLRNYTNGSVATTWMISYKAVRLRSEAAANLLLLWAHLDNQSLWYGLLAAASQKSATAAERTSEWIREVARDEMEFIKAISVLRSYSLVEDMEDQTGYATHPVVHQWALQIQDDSQRAALSWVAVTTVGLAVPTRDTKKYWEMQVRLLSHAGACEAIIKGIMRERVYEPGQAWLQEGMNMIMEAIHGLGVLFADQGRLDKAEEMYQRALQGKEKAWGLEHTSTLNTVNNLGSLYVDLGRMDEAEKMYQRALQGKEKALGLEHTSTLDTVNNLGSLYEDLGRMDEAEKMYQRALRGYEKAIGVDRASTYIPALNSMWGLASLARYRGGVEDARIWYSKSLSGYQKVLGNEHQKVITLSDELAALDGDIENGDTASDNVSPTSKRHRVLHMLGWRRKQA